MTTNTDHLTIKTVDGGHIFHCAICSKGEFIALPIPLDEWVATSKRFLRAHAHRSKPAAPKTERLEF